MQESRPSLIASQKKLQNKNVENMCLQQMGKKLIQNEKIIQCYVIVSYRVAYPGLLIYRVMVYLLVVFFFE